VITTTGMIHTPHGFDTDDFKGMRSKEHNSKFIISHIGTFYRNRKPDRWDVPQLLKAMDIYVQPSIKESFGIGIVEAMYSGLPVVATKTGGIPEVVQGEGTGILVPPRNSEALSEALLNLIGNPEMANRMGERGRKIAASKFSGRRYAKEMEKLYVSLLSGFHS